MKVWPTNGGEGGMKITKQSLWWNTDINCPKYKKLKETESKVSKKQNIRKEVKNYRKEPNIFLDQKYNNWNENFTRQLQRKTWANRRKNQIKCKIGQLKLSVWNRKEKKENHRESNLNFDLQLSS